MINFDKQQDYVQIIAPASPARNSEGEMDIVGSYQKLAELATTLEHSGFLTKYSENIFTMNKLPYLAAPKEIRQQQLLSALQDPEVKIIFAFRGGYGSSEIALEASKLAQINHKILIGFSDITVLHILFNQQLQLPSIHASMDIPSLPKTLAILEGEKQCYTHLQPFNQAAKEQQIESTLIGGNLSLLAHLAGSKLAPDFTNKIVFIEDTNEQSYQIHRYLLQLNRASNLHLASGIIFGDFTSTDKWFNDTITEFATNYLPSIPIYFLPQAGHGEVNNPIIFGSKAVVKFNELIINNPFTLKR